MIIFAFFHDVGIRFSDKHLVYSSANVFEMVFFHTLYVSIWSLPDAVPFFISRSAASMVLSLVFLSCQCGL